MNLNKVNDFVMYWIIKIYKLIMKLITDLNIFARSFNEDWIDIKNKYQSYLYKILWFTWFYILIIVWVLITWIYSSSWEWIGFFILAIGALIMPVISIILIIIWKISNIKNYFFIIFIYLVSFTQLLMTIFILLSIMDKLFL